ncbi:MAG: hypothetical protein K2X02_06040 [Alphaproteobacteria bacterium]|nr:hypothetical protein [Alphaproteobacteria bacterium]
MVKKLFDMENEILVLSSEEQLRFYYLLEESQRVSSDLSKAIQRYKKIRPKKVRDVN